jgi:hypothetical protein
MARPSPMGPSRWSLDLPPAFWGQRPVAWRSVMLGHHRHTATLNQLDKCSSSRFHITSLAEVRGWGRGGCTHARIRVASSLCWGTRGFSRGLSVAGARCSARTSVALHEPVDDARSILRRTTSRGKLQTEGADASITSLSRKHASPRPEAGGDVERRQTLHRPLVAGLVAHLDGTRNLVRQHLPNRLAHFRTPHFHDGLLRCSTCARDGSMARPRALQPERLHYRTSQTTGTTALP